MSDRTLKRLGEEITRRRQERGWTRQELADRSGLHRNYVRSVENGERNVSVLNLVRIAAVFEIDVLELLRPVFAGAAPEGEVKE